MTRILQCGFETGDTAQEGSDTSSSAPLGTQVAIVSSTPTPRSGNYCLKLTNTASGVGSFTRKHFGHLALTEVWYAFGFFAHTVSEAGTLTLFRNFSSDGFTNIFLEWDTGIIRAYVVTGSWNQTNLTGTLLGSSPTAYSIDNWHLIEIRHIPHLTNGTLQVYINGALVIDASGVKTANSSASVVSASDFDLFLDRHNSGGNVGTYFAFDDIRVNSTAGSVNNGKPGDGKIIGLVPNGAGTYTQLTPSAGSNWQCVDEVPPNTTDYVSHATIGNKDTYTFTDPVTTGNLQAVAAIAMAQNADGGGGSIGFLVRSGGIDNEAAPTPITATWTYYKRIMELDPTDNAAWTTAKLTALEAGVVVR